MIAIIPARGGSKGLPGKNIRKLYGKPLIAYTIEAALKAKSIDRVIVTTDSHEIADVARKFGAEVPFIRPAELATDYSNARDVYIHAIDHISENNGGVIDKFMVLLPTAPFRNERHIEEAIEQFYQKNATTLISVKEAPIPATWYLNKDKNDYINNAGFGSGDAVSNRQVNDKYFIPNGAIYILDYMLLKKQKTYYCDKTVGYVMPEDVSVDIDTLSDFEYAEFLLGKRLKECMV